MRTSSSTTSGESSCVWVRAAPLLIASPTTSSSALADIGERQAVALALAGHRIERVAHHDGHESPAHLAADGHRAALGARLDAVIDRVLEQRLDHEARHQRLGGQRVGFPVYVQPPA